MSPQVHRTRAIVALYLRAALGISFLSAVADRFGLWGPEGTPGVAWGNLQSFLAYTAMLTPPLPATLTFAIGWIVTIAELALGVTLVLGFRVRESALGAGLLLLLFALGMALAEGVKSPLDFSVFTASAGALFLALHPSSALSLDSVVKTS